MSVPVEVHPDSGLPLLEQAGRWRGLGCLPPRPACGLPAFGAGPTAPLLLPPDRWREGNLHADWPQVNTDDQANTMSCVGHAIESAFTYSWLAAGGKFKVFSPTWVYGLINGGHDRGAVISDGMNAVKLFGVTEAEHVPEGMIFRSQFPSTAYPSARRHKAVETYHCPTFAAIGSALSCGFAVVSGIRIGKNFGDLNGEGVAPLPDQYVGGHAMCHVGLTRGRGGRWLVLTHNSWGTNWGTKDSAGQGGFCYLTEEHWQGVYIDAWAIVGVAIDPEDADARLPRVKHIVP